jgi:hypothetical protein
MLVGIIDPSHAEREDDEPGRLPRWMSLEELLSTAEDPPGGPKWAPWTWETIHAALSEWQERDYISVTMLVGDCGRSKVIERKEDFVLSIDTLYAALRGTQVHRTLESGCRPGGLAEARFFARLRVPKIEGRHELSCRPDLITTLGSPTLWDYKVVRDAPAYQYPRKEHTRQVNFNRYIVNHAERWELPDGGVQGDMPFDPRTLVFEHLALVYLSDKWPKVMECTKPTDVTFKNGKKGKRNLPYVWSDEEVLDELSPRLKGMLLALGAYPEWPEGLEEYPGFEGPPGWQCPGPPRCYLKCVAKSWPNGLIWDKDGVEP